MTKLSDRFNRLRLTDSSINEHLETLRRYAQSADVVCELGVDIGQSTTAFLMGQPSTLFSFDLVMKPELEELFNVARFSKTCPNRTESIIGDTFWVFNCPWDTSKQAVPACDLLFIDTWHCYQQLASELALNHRRARKWIIMHDTESFGAKGEGWQDWAASDKGELIGIVPAIVDFLEAHMEWVIKEEYPNNNGLTILGRRL